MCHTQHSLQTVNAITVFLILSLVPAHLGFWNPTIEKTILLACIILPLYSKNIIKEVIGRVSDSWRFISWSVDGSGRTDYKKDPTVCIFKHWFENWIPTTHTSCLLFSTSPSKAAKVVQRCPTWHGAKGLTKSWSLSHSLTLSLALSLSLSLSLSFFSNMFVSIHTRSIVRLNILE